MTRIIRPLLFLSLFLCACSLSRLTPKAMPPTFAHEAPTTEHTPVLTLDVPTSASTVIAVTEVPNSNPASTVDPSYPRQCGYQWAQKPLPELSGSFQQSMQALQADAQAYAFAFGEDCIYADGSATFIPMETDFNITIPIGELSDEEAGEWIVKIMQVIDNIPPDQIIGRRPGRVSILFEANGQRKGASFYIDQYHALPSGLSNAEIYRALQSQQ